MSAQRMSDGFDVVTTNPCYGGASGEIGLAFYPLDITSLATQVATFGQPAEGIA